MRSKKDTLEMIERLKKEYSADFDMLDYEDAWQLLVSVRLAAQCTDERVNQTTEILFKDYPTLEDLAAAPEKDILKIVRPCGLGPTKAKDIAAFTKILVEKYDGLVPDTMEELLELPGIGRKSANLILGDIYKQPGVVVVDTHCIRLANRLGYVKSKNPETIERELKKVLPPEESNDLCHRWVMHGRAVCTARNAYCDKCVLNDICPKVGVE